MTAPKGIMFLIIFSVLMCSCSENEKNILYQFSTIESLLAGNYDGQFPVMKINSFGDFGIGTFDKLDGEMILLNGTMYKAKSDGTITTDVLKEKSPYASVCNFYTTQTIDIDSIISIQYLDSVIKRNIPRHHMIYAVMISSNFDTISYRSVSKQQSPYIPLVDAVKMQTVFAQNNIDGTLVGFYSPSAIKDINVQGLHIHFLSKDFKRGGHALQLKSSKKVTIRIAELKGMYLEMGYDIIKNATPINQSTLHSIEN